MAATIISKKEQKNNKQSNQLSDKQKDMFEEQIKPMFIELEDSRKQQFNNFQKIVPICAIGAVGVIYSGLTIMLKLEAGTDLIIYGIFIALTGLYYLATKPIRYYKSTYKNKILPIIIKAYSGYDYDEKARALCDISLKDFENIPSFDYHKGEDLFKCKIDDVEMLFSELKLKRKDQSSRYNSYTTVFKGSIIMLDMPFKFLTHTVVKKDHGKFFNAISSKFTKKQVVRLENPEFEKLFEVYADDQQASRYILSPVMMEEIVKLFKLFKNNIEATSLTCEFKDNKVLFMIEFRKNMLEPASLFTSAYKTEKLRVVKEEIKAVSGIIKQLKLDYLAAKKTAYKKLDNSSNE